MKFNFTLKEPYTEADYDAAASSDEPMPHGVSRAGIYLVSSYFASKVEEARNDGIPFQEAWNKVLSYPALEPASESPMVFGSALLSVIHEYWGDQDFLDSVNR